PSSVSPVLATIRGCQRGAWLPYQAQRACASCSWHSPSASVRRLSLVRVLPSGTSASRFAGSWPFDEGTANDPRRTSPSRDGDSSLVAATRTLSAPACTGRGRLLRADS